MEALLNGLLDSRRHGRNELKFGKLHIGVDGGFDVTFTPRDGTPCFATTELFNVVTTGTSDLDAEQRAKLGAFVARLKAIEVERPKGMSDAVLSRFLRAAWLMRDVPREAVQRLARELAISPDAGALTQHDMQFYMLADVQVPFADFVAQKGELKVQYIKAGIDPTFAARSHALVIGVPRSGTRWLFEILRGIVAAQHPKALTILDGLVRPVDVVAGEVKPNRFFELIREQNMYFDDTLERPLLNACVDTTISAIHLLVPPADLMLAKCSANHASRLLLKELSGAFPNLKFINIVRDPRNVLLSQKYFEAGGGGAVLQRRLPEIVNWAAACKKQVEELGGLTLKYEPLMADLPGGIRQIADYLGMPMSDDAIEKLQKSVSFESMSGGRKYGDKKDGQHFRGGSDWQEEFSEEEKELVRTRFRGLIKMLGYDV